MARIYNKEDYGVNYQGSAQSVQFNPVAAVNLSRREEQKRRNEVANLELKNRTLNRTQKIESSNLKQMQSAESAILRAEQAGEKSKLSMLKGLTQLSDTLSKGVGDVLIKRAEQAEAKDQIKAAFDVGSGYASGNIPPVVESAKKAEVDNAQSAVASEKAVQAVAETPNQAEALREVNNQRTSEFQIRRGSAYQLASQFPAFYQSFVNSDQVFTRPDGSPFTAATVKNSADIALIDAAARSTFYSQSGLKDLPTQQVLSTLILTVTNTSSSWVTTANGKLIEGKNKQRQEDAKVSLWAGLDAGEDLSVVFQNGASDFFNSGNYVGNQGGANADAVQTILDWAVRNKRKDVIEQLKNVEKVPGNKGTKLGNQYADKFEKAEEGVIDESLSDDLRTRNQAKNELMMFERERQSALANAETPEDEVRINKEYAERYLSLETPEGDLEGAKLQANPNYSQFTALDMKQRQDQGEIFLNEELKALADSGEITLNEAKSLGWNGTEKSAGQEARETADTYKSDADASGRAAVLEAVDSRGLTPDDKNFLLSGDGKYITNDISARLRRELATKITNGELKDDEERRAWLKRRGEQMAAEVILNPDTGKLEYTFGGPNGSSSQPVSALQATLKHPQTGNPALDLRGRDAAEIKSRADATIYGSFVLSDREIFLAQEAVRTGKPIPASIEAKAIAMGTNGLNLLRGQENMLGLDQAELEERPASAASNYQSTGDLTQYDTGQSYGGVSLDNLRNSIIGNESGGNYQAVNPDTGALGYGQVLPGNVASWSRAALGYTISQRQFLASPELQMKVINHRFESMMRDQKAAGYEGEELVRRVASTWYSGRPGLWNNQRPQYSNGQQYPSIANYTLDIWNRYNGR